MSRVPRSAAAEAQDLRDRLEAAGAEDLDTADCLAFALRRGGGAQAAGWAERLLGEFGSLAEVLGASRAALRRVATPAVARDVEVLQALHLRALREPLSARPRISSSSDLIAYLRAALGAERREQVRVLFLDHRNRLIRDEVMGHGTVDHAPVYPREVMRRALELDAAALVLAHNHPGGDATPSTADIEITRRVVEAGRALRVAVHDHVVVAGEAVASFRALGLL